MSIARGARQVLKVRRTLIFSAAMCPVPIKDLKDLRALLCRRDTIDMQDLKDLKRCFSRVRSRGTGPRATGKKRHSLHPRSRGTGPRATVKKTPVPHRRARACPSPSSAQSNARGGQAPALRKKTSPPSSVLAGDRPPRYGKKRSLSS